MCGRARLATDVSEIKIQFGIPDTAPLPNFPARWNIAPTAMLPMVRRNPESGERHLTMARWGLVPAWSPTEVTKYATFNARAETLATAPAFRGAWRAGRRCLIPVDGYYEWRREGKAKMPHAVGLASGMLMALGGLWESWRSPTGEVLRSFTIVTMPSTGRLATLHDRMPLIVESPHWPAWLGETAASPASLLNPCPDEILDIWPVGPAVGNVRNEGPTLVARLAA
jgi:putative SOS response-associated peptidase YedK